MFKDSEKTISTVVKVGLAVIVLIFTLFGFFIPQKCDIDAVYLWCRLHPLSVGDIVGLTLFYGGAFMLSGLWKKWFTLGNEANSSKWNYILFAILALGIILIWNT